MSDVFISYSRRDQAFVRRFADRLTELGLDVWVDWEDIRPTSDWFEGITKGIRESNSFLFVVSPDSVASQMCSREVEYAEAQGKRIVPVLHRDIGQAVAPEPIARRHWIFFDEEAKFEPGIATLQETLATDLDYVNAHTQWLTDAERWDTGGRDRAALLRGAQLQAAERWLTVEARTDREPAPTPLQYEYILASRKASSRRQRRVVAISGVAVAAMAVLSVFAVLQRNTANQERKVAQSRELSSSALLNLPTDPELSLLLSHRAAGIEPTEQATEALRQSLLESRVRLSMTAEGELSSIGFSPDGERVAAGAADGRIHLWEARTGRLVDTLTGHGRPVHSLRFDEEGDTMISAAQDGSVRLWDPRDGRSLGVLTDKRDHRVTGIDISPDGSDVAIGNFRFPAQVWDRERAAPTATLEGIEIGTGAVEFSPQGDQVLVTGQDATARVYDTADGAQAEVLEHRGDHVDAAEWSPDGTIIATGDSKGNVTVWRSTGERLDRLRGHNAQVDQLAFSPDGTLLVSGGDDRTARLFDLAQGGALRAALTGHTDSLTGIAFSPDGQVVATASEDATVRLWDVLAGREIASLRGHRGAIRGLAYSPDGSRLATAGTDGTVRVWAASADAFSRAQRQPLNVKGDVLLARGARFALVSDTATEEPTQVIADLRTGKTTPAGVPADMSPVALSPDGRTILATRFDAEAALVVAGGGEPRVLTGSKGSDPADFSADGRLVALATREEIAIYDVATARRRAHWRWQDGPDEGIFAVDGVRFSPDGKLLMTVGEDGTARVWEISGARELRRMPVPEPPRGMYSQDATVDFSADGTLAVVTVGWDIDAHVFDVRSGQEVATLEGHAGVLISARFSPDDRFVVTSGYDGTVRVWDPTSGRSLAALRPGAGDTDRLGAETATAPPAFFSADGSTLLIAEGERIAAYECDVCGGVDSLVKLAGERATRELTPLERAKYLHEG